MYCIEMQKRVHYKLHNGREKVPIV